MGVIDKTNFDCTPGRPAVNADNPQSYGDNACQNSLSRTETAVQALQDGLWTSVPQFLYQGSGRCTVTSDSVERTSAFVQTIASSLGAAASSTSAV